MKIIKIRPEGLKPADFKTDLTINWHTYPNVTQLARRGSWDPSHKNACCERPINNLDTWKFSNIFSYSLQKVLWFILFKFHIFYKKNVDF